MALFHKMKDDFASLLDMDYDRQWNAVMLEDLDESERPSIQLFHNAAAPGTEIDPEVLLVQAENGFLKDIYAASLRRADDGSPEEGGLTIKLGANIYPAGITVSQRTFGTKTINEYLITCGELFGELQFADEDSEAEVKIDGKPVKITYTRCWVLMTAGNDEEWRVPLTLDLTLRPTKQGILDSVADGTLSNWLKPVSTSGGGEARPMVELGEGMFKVTGLRPTAKSWIIEIDGRGEFWSRGNAEKQLQNPVQLEKLNAGLADNNLYLKIGNIQEKLTREGKKVYLDCTFRVPAAAVIESGSVTAPEPATGKAKGKGKGETAPKVESEATPALTPNYDALPF